MSLHPHPGQRQFATTAKASQSDQLDLALATAEDGFPVHPVDPISKKPLTIHGFKDATTDVAQIIQWWNRWPNALVSVPTGEDTRLAVLDIDIGGETAFGELLARMQIEVFDLSRGRVRTPSGGYHYYFRVRTRNFAANQSQRYRPEHR